MSKDQIRITESAEIHQPQSAVAVADQPGEAAVADALGENINAAPLSTEELKAFMARALSLKPRVRALYGGPRDNAQSIKLPEDSPYPEAKICMMAGGNILEIAACTEYHDEPFTIGYHNNGDILFIQDDLGFNTVTVKHNGTFETSCMDGQVKDPRGLIQRTLNVMEQLLSKAGKAERK